MADSLRPWNVTVPVLILGPADACLVNLNYVYQLFTAFLIHVFVKRREYELFA